MVKANSSIWAAGRQSRCAAVEHQRIDRSATANTTVVDSNPANELNDNHMTTFARVDCTGSFLRESIFALVETDRMNINDKKYQYSARSTTMLSGLLNVSILCLGIFALFASPPTAEAARSQSAEVPEQLQSGLSKLQTQVEALRAKSALQRRDGKRKLADVEVFAKSVEWMLRHREFPKKEYAKQAAKALETGSKRASELLNGKSPWEQQIGTTVRAYYSRIDGSVQPYALTIPEGVDPDSGTRWPLHLKLHGRANDMNEVNFIHRHEGKPLPKEQNWIQLDVYGRGNNAYRWAGETDVFEALADVKRRFRIDENRITLHGFSMGGAGAWHLGVHYPSTWSSVGPGAGFVDFYNYQNQTEQRPPWQHANLSIYDAVDYAMNAANVPICTYGGENDSQLLAGTTMVDAAEAVDVDIKLLIGPGMGHKFHPDSFKEFMMFHQEKSKLGRQRNQGRRKIRFATRTLKYNSCDWLTIHEVERVYQPATIEATLTAEGNVKVRTENITAFSLARDIAQFVEIQGKRLPCNEAGEGLLPNVYYQNSDEGWSEIGYRESLAFLKNPARQKRKNLQGPIDDAFMEPFLCVTGSQSGTAELDDWAQWTLARFEREFDKWMRAKIPIVTADSLDDIPMDRNLILFGTPESNPIIKKLAPSLPIEWTDKELKIGSRSFSTDNHGLSLIYPNPHNVKHYIVINSGHTFHENDFKASNSWLFPRLGDIAIQKFTRNKTGNYDEEIVWAANFKTDWQLSPGDLPK